MCARNLIFFVAILFNFFSSFALNSTLPTSASRSCFPMEAEVSAVKERLEDWLSKVFGEHFPFEMEPRHLDGAKKNKEGGGEEMEDFWIFKDELENKMSQDNMLGREGGVRDGVLGLRGKTGFFELDQVFFYTDFMNIFEDRQHFMKPFSYKSIPNTRSRT